MESDLLGDYEEFVLAGASNKVPEDFKLVWALLGAGAELGEVQEVVEKALRKKGYLDDDDYDKLHDELGDVIWYLTHAIISIDSGLEDVIVSNIVKLKERARAKAIEAEGAA